MRTPRVRIGRQNVGMSQTTVRALRLLDLLQTHRHWSGVELTDRLGVTSRTLRRDVERLRQLGYRIESSPGSAGGYRLEAGSALPPLLLTDDEAVSIAIGLRLAAAQGLVDGEHTTLTALAKLEQVLPSALRARVAALGGSVEPFRPERVPVPADLLARLALACRDRERLRFRYISGSGEPSDRLVEPQSLVAAQRSWFLLAWDVQRDDWRTFRVDRLDGLVQTRVRVAERQLPGGDAAEYVAAAIEAWSGRGEPGARAVMQLPYADMVAFFGPWSRGAEAVDAQRTAWPISGRGAEEIAAALAWIPAGVEYELEADAVTRAAIRELGERMLRATI